MVRRTQGVGSEAMVVLKLGKMDEFKFSFTQKLGKAIHQSLAVEELQGHIHLDTLGFGLILKSSFCPDNWGNDRIWRAYFG